jgi:hypothetical protein
MARDIMVITVFGFQEGNNLICVKFPLRHTVHSLLLFNILCKTFYSSLTVLQAACKIIESLNTTHNFTVPRPLRATANLPVVLYECKH